MNRIEQELFDLEEHLRRNDDIADNSAYLTIIDIANKVSELDAENAKLRELIADVHEALRADKAGMFHKLILASMEDDLQKLGIEEVPHD